MSTEIILSRAPALQPTPLFTKTNAMATTRKDFLKSIATRTLAMLLLPQSARPAPVETGPCAILSPDIFPSFSAFPT